MMRAYLVAAALVLVFSSPVLANGTKDPVRTWVWFGQVQVYMVWKPNVDYSDIARQLNATVVATYPHMAPGEVIEVEVKGNRYQIRKPSLAELAEIEAQADAELEAEEIEALYRGAFRTTDVDLIKKVMAKHPDWKPPQSIEDIERGTIEDLYWGTVTTSDPVWIEKVIQAHPDWNPTIDSQGVAHGHHVP